MRLRIFTEPQNGASYDQQLVVARLTEELGFDGFFRSDHYLRIGEGDPMPGPTDAWVTLGGLARETRAIRLGTLVTPVTFRFPGPLAISVAEVDAMSGGRVELGLGAGWYDDEHLAYGIPYPAMRQRFEMLEEQLEIITGLWKTPVGERFDYEGRHYRLSNSPALPKPLQRPHPPIILGGFGSKRTPALAARFASEFNVPFPPLDLYREMVQRVREACARQGRDSATLRTTVALTVCCGQNEAELELRAANIGRTVADLRANALAGLPNEIVDRLTAYHEAGAQIAYLQMLDINDLDHIRLLAAEVLPKVQTL